MMFQFNPAPKVQDGKIRFCDLASTLSSLLAYASDLSGAAIVVTDDCGVFVLEGTAPAKCIPRVSEIAVGLVGFRVCNLVVAI